MRYACHDPTQVANPNSPLLGLLQEAVRKNGSLGEVVQYVNNLLGRHPTRFSHLVVLDKDQSGRRIHEPNR
jgi:hypothetical protein